MSILKHVVPITTDGTGVDASTVELGPCRLLLLRVEVGTLTTPDIAITEEDNGRQILSVSALAADADYFPAAVGSDDAGVDVAGSALPAPVIGRLLIAIASGGANKTGEITILYER